MLEQKQCNDFEECMNFYMYFDNFVSDCILNHVFNCILILLDCAIWPFGHEAWRINKSIKNKNKWMAKWKWPAQLLQSLKQCTLMMYN